MPWPRGFDFIVRVNVDAYHISDTVRRRGLLVYLNSALSSLGSDFSIMKQCCEYIRGLVYKLRMKGILCDDPAYIDAYNQSASTNTISPDSILNKQYQSIAYQMVRKGVAWDEQRLTYFNTHDNVVDFCTKHLLSGEKRRGYVMNITHHIIRIER